MRCRLCNSDSATEFGTTLVLRKHRVTYWRCDACGFVQTEQPYWLEEAYSTDVTAIDLGPVNRGITIAEKTRALILAAFNPKGAFLDYGAGYGIFVRRMRDLGFDFCYYDKYGQNLFARGFESRLDSGKVFELITAIEVFEHMVEPLSEIQSLLSHSDSIFFTTELMPPDYPAPDKWWYYAPEHGQHISFFSRQSLERLAERLGVRYLGYAALHLLTRRRIPRHRFRVAMDPRFTTFVGHALSRYRGVQSLLDKDFSAALRRMRKGD